ncbi:hypothetical protein ON010_g18549 [Phytophthora cinnamomi]|nr:hypothetical protein ON010_g18549 [Phytophthora cinnamomi]
MGSVSHTPRISGNQQHLAPSSRPAGGTRHPVASRGAQRAHKASVVAHAVAISTAANAAAVLERRKSQVEPCGEGPVMMT